VREMKRGAARGEIPKKKDVLVDVKVIEVKERLPAVNQRKKFRRLSR